MTQPGIRAARAGAARRAVRGGRWGWLSRWLDAPPPVQAAAPWAEPAGQPAGGPTAHDATGGDIDEAVPPGGARPGQPRGTGICCSGGGIRSAAFNLGGLQALSAAGIYKDADFVTAVSGGSYTAAGFASVTHGPRFPADSDGSGGDDREVSRPVWPDYAYAPGSAEERHLRNNSNYLFPRLAVTVRGIVWLVFGLLANLAMLLVFVFVAARIVGWLARSSGVLTGLDGADPALRLPNPWWVVAVSPLGLGVLSLLMEKFVSVYRQPTPTTVRRLRRAATSLLALGALTVILLLALPAANVALKQLALTNRPDPTTARVIATLGFAAPGACREAAARAAAEPDGAAHGACGAAPRMVDDAADNARTPATWDVSGLIGFVAALAVVIRRFVRVFGGYSAGLGRDRTGRGPPGAARQLLQAAERRLLGWTGSALVVAAALLLSARWVNDAAVAGVGTAEAVRITVAVAVLLLLMTVTDINRNSLHPYYREQLASAYIVRRVREDGRTLAEPVPYERPLSLSQVAPDDGVGGPELVICAAANITDQSVPPGRGCVPFIFTPRQVGLPDPPPRFIGRPEMSPDGLLSLDRYERAVGRRQVTLPGAVAVSGAAISPLAGKATRPSQRLVLAVANVRLGMWLPNPMRVGPDGPARNGRLRALLAQWRRPGPWHLLLELAGHTHLGQRWLYVTDGGHYDNLGLVEALRRRPATLFVFDGSGDPVNRWSTIGGALALARSEHGIDVEIDPSTMEPVDTQFVRTPYVRGDVWYPPVDRSRPPDAEVWVTKLGVTERSPWDVRSYARRFPTFPCDGTIHQRYGGEQLEAYRALGHDSTNQMLAAMTSRRAAARAAEDAIAKAVADAAAEAAAAERAGRADAAAAVAPGTAAVQAEAAELVGRADAATHLLGGGAVHRATDEPAREGTGT